VIWRQANSFGLRIVMVALLGLVYLDVRHIESIEEVSC
jgi:hypothetical protein